MNRYTLLALAVGLVVGVFIGYQAGSSAPPSVAPMAGAPQMPPGMPQAMPPAGDPGHVARIASLQAVVARDPKNVQAWVQLGNDYFDTRQPQKAVEAYGRALELKPDDPDVMTDQGVMYRDLGQFEKAVQNFEQANRIDPKHVQSLFNLGVVHAHDLGQPKKAEEAWRKVIELAPQSPQAIQARQALQQLGTPPR
jgi:cytochrome c-type biogenesis protein CcmH/NrfG